MAEFDDIHRSEDKPKRPLITCAAALKRTLCYDSKNNNNKNNNKSNNKNNSKDNNKNTKKNNNKSNNNKNNENKNNNPAKALSLIVGRPLPETAPRRL